MADGYARVSGRVGVAVATSGPGATNLVTGIATAMMDSTPMVCITGQVPAALLGSDAFQETDITGITLPITKHNYLVQRAADIAPVLHDAFRVATSGRMGPVLVDITKNAQQELTEWSASAGAGRARVRAHRGVLGHGPRTRHGADRPGRAPGDPGGTGAAEERGDGRAPAARRAGSPAGGRHAARHRRPARRSPAQPRHDGDARRALGERSHSGRRPADRPRHALRRPRDRPAGAVCAAGEEDPHRHRPVRTAEERARRRRHRGRPPHGAARLAAAGAAGPPRRLADPHPLVRGWTDRARPRRHRRPRPAAGGAGDSRHLAGHRRPGHRRHRRRPAPDVGGAVLPRRRAEHLGHLRWPGDDGLRPAGGDRRQARPAGPRGVGHRRRRRLPDDPGGTDDARCRRA